MQVELIFRLLGLVVCSLCRLCACAATARWVEALPHTTVAEAVLDTALEVADLTTEELEYADSTSLKALAAALDAPWLEGLRLHGDTARRVYAKRPLSAESVRIMRLATRSLELEEAEILLADVEPCLARHDSRGVVALLDWLGVSSRGEPRPVFVRLLHGLLQTARLPSTASSHAGDVAVIGESPGAKGIDSPAPGAVATGEPGSGESAVPGATTTATSYIRRRMCPAHHSRASVEAVEFLLRRSPEAREHPLSRVLRHSARGRKYNVFVCNAATVLRHRRLAAEEAGKDTGALRELQEVLGNADSTAARARVGGSSSPIAQTPPSVVPPLVMSTPTSPTPGPGSSSREGATTPGVFAAPPPRPPANPPPPRRSPRRAPQAGHQQRQLAPTVHGGTSASCRPAEPQQRETHHGVASRLERAGDDEHAGAVPPALHPSSPPPRTLCQALAARAARGLPPLGASPALGARVSPQRTEDLRLRGCSTVRWAGAAALPAIRAQ